MFKEPKYKESAFTCPWCGAYAQQGWDRYVVVQINEDNSTLVTEDNYYGRLGVGWGGNDVEYLDSLGVSTCKACGRYHVWNGEKIIFPQNMNSTIPMPLEDMPQVVKDLYLEARDVYPISHKSACAILRLAVQHLCKELGEKGKNINDDIGSLVSKGLPERIQKALDIVRIVGNNVVHPGVMSEEDTKEYAQKMFKLLNIIVDDRIVQPREIDTLFDELPEGPKKAIERRDS